MKRIYLTVFVLLFLVKGFGMQYYSKHYYYSLEFSDDWSLSNDKKRFNAFFTHKSKEAYIEVFVYELNSARSNEAMYSVFADRFDMDGKYDETNFCSYSALRGENEFTYKGHNFKIDLVVFKDKYYYYLVMGYSTASRFERYREELASTIDSFKLYYDNDVVYSNDSKSSNKKSSTSKVESSKKEPYNEKVEEEKEKASDDVYYLTISWDRYKNNEFEFTEDELNQSVKELDAMMQPSYWDYFNIDYRNDRDYEFTLWKKFYQEVYNKNYYRVNDVVDWFKGEATKKGWSSYDLAYNVIKSIQAIPYERPYNIIKSETSTSRALDYFTPNQVAWYNKGDCDTKSMFIILVLRRLGYDALIYFSFDYSHAMVGLNINGSGDYKEYNNRKYYFVESTYPGWKIGDLPPQMRNTKKWRIIPIK